MSDAWFANHIAPDGNEEDGCHPQEAAALKEYLRSETMTVQEAAHAITAAVEADSAPSDILYRLWTLLIDALKDLRDQRIKIIQLLKAIQKLAPTSQAENASQDLLQWNELGDFGHLWSDMSVDNLGGVNEYDPQRREAVRHDFINEAVIESQLVLASVGKIPLSWGLTCIANALECKDAILDFQIMAAEAWLSTCGGLIRSKVGKTKIGKNTKRELWKGDEELSEERWNFWEKRLVEIHEKHEVGQATRDIAMSTLMAMQAADLHMLYPLDL